MNLKDHEKFIAFVLLGLALMTMAIMLYIKPIADSNTNSGVLQILNMIIGAIISAFGGAANALFRTSDQVKVTNTAAEPVPTDPTATDTPKEELPDYAR
jgi:hypothetical protein